MPKTSVSPVIFKIFRIRCRVQTRSSEPSCARTRFSPDQHPEAGGVEEPDLVQVDDELVAALADQVDEQLPQPRRRIHIDLALHVDDLEAVPVTQLQIHTSSSATPGVISPSIPAPRAGVVRGQGGSPAALRRPRSNRRKDNGYR
jgi:hypothetical protein